MFFWGGKIFALSRPLSLSRPHTHLSLLTQKWKNQNLNLRRRQLVGDLVELALDRQVDLRRAVLDDEAGDQRLVDLGLELDVLRAGQLLELLRDQELLLLLELDGRAHDGDLRVGQAAVELLEGDEDLVGGDEAVVVDEQAEEVERRGVEAGLRAEALEEVLLLLGGDAGVGEELLDVGGVAEEGLLRVVAWGGCEGGWWWWRGVEGRGRLRKRVEREWKEARPRFSLIGARSLFFAFFVPREHGGGEAPAARPEGRGQTEKERRKEIT